MYICKKQAMNIYIKSFILGFLYVFGLAESPIASEIKEIIFRDDAKSISKDWKKVGMEMRKAYETAEKPIS
jgi:hypothetical protein